MSRCSMTAAAAIFVISSAISQVSAKTPNDPIFPKQWNMQRVNAPAAWGLHTDSRNVLAAVGWGMNAQHEDLMHNLWVNPDEIPDNRLDDDRNGYIDDCRGWHFAFKTNDTTDCCGYHSSACASIIAAEGNNGVGMAGINWRATLMPLAARYSHEFLPAVAYAKNKGVQIFNLVYGWDDYSEVLYYDIKDMPECLFIAPANYYYSGKDMDMAPYYPAGYDCDNIISVTALDANDMLLPFYTLHANYGRKTVDLGAPGEAITANGDPLGGLGYTIFRGTDIAAAHVGGACIFLKSWMPSASVAQIKYAILKSVDPVPALAGKTVSGGRLNVYKSALELNAIICDMNEDLTVDMADMAILAGQWRGAPAVPSADIAPAGGDGVVDVKDLAALAGNWLYCIAGQPSGPDPLNDAINVTPTPVLAWSSIVPASYDVYFGTANPPPFAANTTDSSFTPGVLSLGTKYYWRIDSTWRPSCKITGRLWSFTVTTMPDPAVNPGPADLAVDVGVTADLNWEAGSYSFSHNIYFGTTNPPPFLANVTSPDYSLSTLNYNTVYYWRIDEVGCCGKRTGAIWRFTTIKSPADYMVSHWQLDGTAADSSGNGHNGTLVNPTGMTWDPTGGKIGGCVNFSGTPNNSYITVPTTGIPYASNASTGAVTLWGKLSASQTAAQRFFFCHFKAGTGKSYIAFRMNDTNTKLDAMFGDGVYSDLVTLSTDTWYHLAVTWSGVYPAQTFDVYVNGLPVKSGTTGNLQALAANGYIGNDMNGATKAFSGRIDDVRFYRRLLTGGEIQEIYQEF